MAFFEVQDIRKKFDNDEVLKGVGFTLEKGEVLAIIGSSGGGKTTLLRCINFLETPDTGRILIGGDEIFNADAPGNEEKQKENRLRIGLVFQQFNLFPQYTALENIELAPRLLKKYPEAEIQSRTLAVLERVGLAEKANLYPYQLSGGQQQRVAIARALVMEPDILCFDEPTSALDPELTGEVLKVIRSLKSAESTMIIVTHEMEFAQGIADKVIFLDHGSIALEGTAKEVFSSRNDRIRAFLGNYSRDAE